jgi:hypothetical protein
MDYLSKLVDVEGFIKALPDSVAASEFPLDHYFVDGMCARAVHIPAGMVVVGKLHKKAHLSVLAQGTLRIFDGLDYKEITAPYVCIDKAGIKRIGYAITDCTFINIVRTDATNVADLENECVLTEAV